jgi:hypothetical protein
MARRSCCTGITSLRTRGLEMTILQITLATTVWLVLITIVYARCHWSSIRDCYGMWLKREYWTDYNLVEFLSWTAKAIIIVPGLIFGISVWWLYWFTLATSLSLIWASNRKLLPTLVGFNTLWAWISCMVLAQHLL